MTTEPSAPPFASRFSIGSLRTRRRQLFGTGGISAGGIAALLAGTFVAVGLIVAVSAPWLAPGGGTTGNLNDALEPPVLFGGTWSHPLGTDDLGRDMLARVIHGARVSLIAGVFSVCVAAVVGTLIGIVSGYMGGTVDAVLMRVVEMQLAFPTILIALIVAAALQPGLSTVMIAIIVVYWSYFARISRAETLKLRVLDYVALARVSGAGPIRITFKHLLPNMSNTLIVVFSLQVASAITFEAALSFLGVGIQPPEASWGSMLGTGRNYVTIAWWLAVVPGVAIFLTVLSLNMVGDWLRDRLDPKGQRLELTR